MPQNKFIDYYEILQVSPNADNETIERVFRLLAKRYHPDNPNTNNLEKFNLITEAHNLLRDPGKRAAYDVSYDEHRIQELRKVYQASNSEAMEFHSLANENEIRFSLLSVLYDERKKDPSNPGVGTWQLEKLLGWPETVLAFHIWYLLGKTWIERLETGMLSITPDGVDIVEEKDRYFENRQLLLK
jgi:hypothetical protein